MSDTQEIIWPDSNRIGKLLILHETLRDDREMIKALQDIAKPIAPPVEHESGRGMVFIVACRHDVPLFDQLREGEEIPEYRLECAFDQAFANPEWQARRIDSGSFGFAAFRKNIIRVPAITATFATKVAQQHQAAQASARSIH